MREAGTKRTVARRSGRARAGRRAVTLLRLNRRPRCGRAVVRITLRGAGRPATVLVRRPVVRRACISPGRRARR